MTFRLEQLLPVACIASAAVLLAAEPMTMFELTPRGGEPLTEQTGGERHGYALAVMAVFAIAATAVAVLAASKPAATGVAVVGVIALLVFLVADLPDAGAVGTVDETSQSFFDAEAVPREGFWLALAGSVGLAVSGIALATLTPSQLAALRPGAQREPGAPREDPGQDGPDRSGGSHRSDGDAAAGPPASYQR